QTSQLSVRINTIDQSSITGNLAVRYDVFVTQLKMPYSELVKAILSINDQVTQAHNRGCKAVRAFDMNPFLRAQIFQLGIGLFHLLLNAHRGHETIEGSLSYFFMILEKARLGGKHPDYHSLLAALMQILDGLLLDAWRIECGASILTAFAATEPTPEIILQTADKILSNHATPTRSPSTTPPDIVRENTRKLIHDLLYVAEVTRAISSGDFGRVEDILSNLAMIFRGAGSKNYCTEILYFMHNLKYVWKGDGFDELVRDNMIFNMTGVRERGQGADHNMEHNIGQVKELFTAKGVYGSWERLANISAAIDVLDSIKTNVAISLQALYAGTSHKTPDTSDLVWRVARKTRELKLNRTQSGRDGKAIPDLLIVGEAVLKSSTLATFNKKRRDLLKGIIEHSEDDVDELPSIDL
ncbi:hypothetical protein DFH09DRAFT_866630, partial [Mycena vulgaris]